MTNSDGSGRSRQGGRRIVPLVVLAAICGTALLGSAGTASANSVLCEGSVTPVNKKKPGLDAKLDFTCDETIRGFSVLTNKTFDFFGTEVDVYQPDGSGSPQSATVQCTGNVPGPGIGCGVVNRNTPSNCEAVVNSGQPTQSVNPACASEISAGNRSELIVGFPQNPCKPAGMFAPSKDKLRIWLQVLTEPLIGAFNVNAPDQTAYTRGAFISPPFRLKIKGYNNCAPQGGKKAKSKGAKSKKASSAAAGIARALAWS